MNEENRSVLPPDQSLELVLNSRLENLKLRLETHLLSLMKRLKLREGNIQELREEDLEISNLLHQIGWNADQPIRPDESILGLKQNILEIQRSTRREHVDCWRDIAPLLKDILAAWELYQQSLSRMNFLSQPPDESWGLSESDKQAEPRSGGDPFDRL